MTNRTEAAILLGVIESRRGRIDPAVTPAARLVPWALAVSQALVMGMLFPAGYVASGATVAPSWEHPPPQQREGVFWREHWYERGLTNHNPAYEKRLRVNPPEISLHTNYGRRVEARENGLMLIPAEEDLFRITGAELSLEIWGGHPGTANKRVTVNGRSTYAFPRVGTEDGHCTYSYPVFPLQRGDLVNGWNAFQLALDQGTTFWGHALVDNACLRVALTNGHPELAAAGLADFSARVVAAPVTAGEGWALRCELPENMSARIARVDFQAWYSGYDDNGNLRGTDWHGFTMDRLPVAHVGSRAAAPFQVAWDTAMLPAQKGVAVRAFVRFKDAPGLVYLTPATPDLAIADRAGAAVHLYAPSDLPQSFWSRAKRLKSCAITLDVAPTQIQRAELIVISWTGGAGGVKEYFKLNGRHFPMAEGSRHVIQFNRLPVEPSLLRHGANVMELLSDTEHHGIEIIYPGPALMVRYKTEP
jgi:hypothetical protein